VPPPYHNSQPEKKSSCLPALGIGCVIFLILGVVGAYFGGRWVWRTAQEYMQKAGVTMEDIQKTPERAMAKIVLATNPDLELVSEDEAAGTFTIKVKSSGETTTISYADIQSGKFEMKSSSGEVVTVDGSNQQGTVTVKNKDGTTVLGVVGSGTTPAWVPLHASMSMLPGGMKSDTADGLKGSSVAESSAPVSTLKAFYEDELKKAGFDAKFNLSGEGTSQNAMITGEHVGEKKTLTIMISNSGESKTNVMLHYSGPKP
jgi:hypothetical protein